MDDNRVTITPFLFSALCTIAFDYGYMLQTSPTEKRGEIDFMWQAFYHKYATTPELEYHMLQQFREGRHYHFGNASIISWAWKKRSHNREG